MAKSVDAGLLESLLSIARNYSLNIGYNDIGNHHISYGSGYHANLSVKVNSEDEITDIIITPISDNPQGAHDHIWFVNTGNPQMEERTRSQW